MAYRRILLIAPNFSDEEVLRSPFASPAASAWTRGLVGALETFAQVDGSLWFSNMPAWPRGPIVQPETQMGSSSSRLKLVRFVNLPIVKSQTVSRALERAIQADATRDAIVFIYGQGTLSVPAVRRLGRMVQRVVVIVPDAPSTKRGLELVREIAEAATGGLLYLPASIGPHLLGRRSLAFHGTVHNVAEVAAPDVRKKKRLVFVGGVDQVSGSDFLVRALENIAASDLNIVIAGRVNDRQSAISLERMGAQVTGFLGAEELDTICSDAYAFLNPRDPCFSPSNTNFPSKILKYMSYSKPILSTDTAGMPRDLVSALGCGGVTTPHALADRIADLLRKPQKEWMAMAVRVREFAIREYSEQTSGRRIAEFIGAAALSL